MDQILWDEAIVYKSCPTFGQFMHVSQRCGPILKHDSALEVSERHFMSIQGILESAYLIGISKCMRPLVRLRRLLSL
jgi:hypothetical protein